MRIGVWDRSSANWSSGTEYTRAQAASLLAVQDEMGFELSIVANTTEREVAIAGTLVPITPQPRIRPGRPGLRELDRLTRFAPKVAPHPLRQWRAWAKDTGIDVLLSFDSPGAWWDRSDLATVTWIWDLQHRVLPDMFAEGYRRSLDRHFRRDAERCELVVVSSTASERDYFDFLPDLANKIRIYRFPSRFTFDPALTAKTDLQEVLDKYGIERGFFLVVNQFWHHKNHEAVVAAAARLQRTTGSCPQIVMIGNPYDDRDPGGSYLSNLLAGIAEAGLEGRVKILGFVSGSDRDALFRSCTALIQPSRFEGWNTSIEDAKAIGRPIIASGLDVHREQAPDAFGFFDVDDPEALAALLASATSLPPGPDLQVEATALADAGADLTEIGRHLHAICVEATELARARGARLPSFAPVSAR